MSANPRDPTIEQTSESTLEHHKVSPPPSKKETPAQKFNPKIIYKVNGKSVEKPYGVSNTRRVITPGLLRKHWHDIRHFLTHQLGLTTAEREAVFRLLRLAAYYPHVYPKAAQIADLPGTSKSTFWRAIAKLKGMGMITVVNRFLIREEAQISNLYIMRRLCLAIARYLHEHSVRFGQDWLQPFLIMPARRFWRAIKKWPWTLDPVAT